MPEEREASKLDIRARWKGLSGKEKAQLICEHFKKFAIQPVEKEDVYSAFNGGLF